MIFFKIQAIDPIEGGLSQTKQLVFILFVTNPSKKTKNYHQSASDKGVIMIEPTVQINFCDL
jgi:hypothetical protein